MSTSRERHPLSIVPKPYRTEIGEGQLHVSGKVAILLPEELKEVEPSIRAIVSRACETCRIQIGWDTARAGNRAVPLNFHMGDDLGEATGRGGGQRGYRMVISSTGVDIEVPNASSAVMAAHSLAEIMWNGAAVSRGGDRAGGAGAITLPVATIEDGAAWSWRGMHLDVSRHFLDVGEVLRYIDLLAAHKFNLFHWHLTDDQGWRFESASYPRLQEVGAYRERSDGPYGGYYTREDMKTVVEHAANLGITVVPEINMPGHVQSAIASYPSLSCRGEPISVWNDWGISEEVLCVASEETYRFAEHILAEVAEIFPGPFIHVGGDECPTTRWMQCPRCSRLYEEEGYREPAQLQGYFFDRIHEMVRRLGKTPIAWDEVLHNAVPDRTVVTTWHGTQYEHDAAQRGLEVVSCPLSTLYFDWPQSDAPDEPGVRYEGAGVTTLEDVYNFDPGTEIESGLRSQLLGAQGNVWTETMPNAQRVHYMAYPRMAALAEVLWSGNRRGTVSEFKERLSAHDEYLKSCGILK